MPHIFVVQMASDYSTIQINSVNIAWRPETFTKSALQKGWTQPVVKTAANVH